MYGIATRGVLSRPRMPLGCMECFAGGKTVIFITGLCHDNCYYCPVSREKLGRDVMYANETRIHSLAEILYEIDRSGSTSASITGGDPLVVPLRTIDAIQMLKSTYGQGFHIHLYTSGRYASRALLVKLDKSGLDEIRFHPTFKGLEKKVELAKKETSMSVGVEVPAIPGEEEKLFRLARYLDAIKADFMNINELEISETNLEALRARRMFAAEDSIAVKGSRETALNVIKKAIREGLEIPIHFCPASFKNRIQTRNRYLRTIAKDIEVYEKPTRQGTVVHGEITVKPGKCRREAEKLLTEGLLFPRKDSQPENLLVHPDNIDGVLGLLGGCVEKAHLVEGHPTRPRRILNIYPLRTG